MTGAEDFIRAHTTVAHAPLVPEIRLHLATDVTPLWHATEGWLQARGVPPPFWAFAWAGGQAVARLLLDQPQHVRGKRVLDVACGGGIVALAATLSGAREVVAIDVDPFAVAAARLNASANGVALQALEMDLKNARAEAFDVVLAGDVCYEAHMAKAALTWLESAASHAFVLLGDPRRTYAPKDGVDLFAQYDVPTDPGLEGTSSRQAAVWHVRGARFG